MGPSSCPPPCRPRARAELSKITDQSQRGAVHLDPQCGGGPRKEPDVAIGSGDGHGKLEVGNLRRIESLGSQMKVRSSVVVEELARRTDRNPGPR